jgi:phospho-N-acetylmuramoyl-pentapeptide-transferase
MDAVFALGLAILISLAAGRPIIAWLRRLKAGQSIKEDGPSWHMSKQGTPTMGGLMFIIGIFAAVLIAGWKEITAGEYGHLLIFLFAVVYGGIGIADDLVKIRKKQNGGFTAPQKFLLQLAVAVPFSRCCATRAIFLPTSTCRSRTIISCCPGRFPWPLTRF